MDYLILAAQYIPIISMACSVIASLTPTPKDDEWIAKWYKIIDLLAINIGKAKK